MIDVGTAMSARAPWSESERSTLEQKTEMRDGYNLHDKKGSINILDNPIYQDAYTLISIYNPVDITTLRKTLGVNNKRIEHVVDELSKYYLLWEGSKIENPFGKRKIRVFGIRK